MKTPRSSGRRAAPRPPQPDDIWQKWTTELPPSTVVLLKMRAAQERRPMRETLADAIRHYVETPVVLR